MRVPFPALSGFSVDLDEDSEGVVGGIEPEPPDTLGGPVRVLVGRDVLRFCVLAVDGLRGVYTLAAEPAPPAPIARHLGSTDAGDHGDSSHVVGARG